MSTGYCIARRVILEAARVLKLQYSWLDTYRGVVDRLMDWPEPFAVLACLAVPKPKALQTLDGGRSEENILSQ